MLQLLRNKAQSIVIQVIVVIIALVFVFWGVGTNMMNSREAAIVVNDEEIGFQDFQQAYDRAYENLRSQFGGTLPQGLVESLGIKQQVINQLVQDSLLRQGAREMGIHVSAREVRDTIRSMAQFQKDGAFSMDQYTTLLAANGFTPTTFEQSIRYDMLAQKVQSSIGQFATTVTEYEVNDLYQLENSEIALRYVHIDQSEYDDTVRVDGEKLEEWFATVQDRYMTPVQMKLGYLDFRYDQVAGKITIDDDSIQSYYQENLSDYTDAEKRRARHILLSATEEDDAELHAQKKKRAEEILAMARAGEAFTELARQYSEGPSGAEGGDLGFFERGQMVGPFEEAAFALSEGEISDVVKTSFGYHIIKVEEIVPGGARSLDEVRRSVMENLQLEQAKPLAFQLANEAYEGIISAGSLDAYLKENPQAELKTTGFFSRNNPPEDLAGDRKLIDAAFALNEGELSSLVETSRGYAILYAMDIKEPEVPELNEVRDQVTADYRKQRAKAIAEETAESLLNAAREAGNLQAAAEKSGFSVEVSDYFRKGGGSQKLPQPLIDGAFRLSANSPLPEQPLEGEGGYYVYEFVDKKVPQQELSEQERSRYVDALLRLKQQQVLTGWLANQRRDAEVYTHKQL